MILDPLLQLNATNRGILILVEGLGRTQRFGIEGLKNHFRLHKQSAHFYLRSLQGFDVASGGTGLLIAEVAQTLPSLS